MVNIACILLELPNGMLVLNRRDQDAPTSPGLLAPFGGHIEESETPEQAAIREMKEETSLPELPLRFLAKFRMNEAGDDINFHVFIAKLEDKDFLVFEGDGFETYMFEDAIKRNDLTESLRHILMNYVKER